MRIPELRIKDKQELVEMVKEVCQALTGKAPGEAVSLLVETAAAESAFYTRIQLGGGPARGLWQVEPATADDIFENYLQFRPGTFAAVLGVSIGLGITSWFMPARSELSDLLEHNDVFCCCMARIVYLRDRDPIPKTVEERAAYWKRVYNTPLGRGTVEHYLEAARALGEAKEWV